MTALSRFESPIDLSQFDEGLFDLITNSGLGRLLDYCVLTEKDNSQIVSIVHWKNNSSLHNKVYHHEVPVSLCINLLRKRQSDKYSCNDLMEHYLKQNWPRLPELHEHFKGYTGYSLNDADFNRIRMDSSPGVFTSGSIVSAITEEGRFQIKNAFLMGSQIVVWDNLSASFQFPKILNFLLYEKCCESLSDTGKSISVFCRESHRYDLSGFDRLVHEKIVEYVTDPDLFITRAHKWKNFRMWLNRIDENGERI
jgi:hypothetical protein